MNDLSLGLETVTPLFLGGADPRDAPELRPPAFRGAMRYWFRAVVGGVIGDKNIVGLHEIENLIFGSTEQGSPISIQIKGDLSKETQSTKILPHKGDSARRMAFKIRKPIELIMRQRICGEQNLDELIWLNACMTLNLLILFGGVGLRSRRGYGTLRILSSNSNLIPKTPTTLIEWQTHIRLITKSSVQCLRALAEKLGIETTDLPNSPTNFPSAAINSLIWLADQPIEDSPENALEKLMSKMPLDRSFGGIVPYTNERNASPVWARVIFMENRYRLLFCVLPAKLKWKDYIDYDKIENFLQTNFPGNNLTIQGWNQ